MRTFFRIVVGILIYTFCMLGGGFLGLWLAALSGTSHGVGFNFCFFVGAACGAFIAWRRKPFHYRSMTQRTDPKPQQFNVFIRVVASTLVFGAAALILFTITSLYLHHEARQQRRGRQEAIRKQMQTQSNTSVQGTMKLK